MLEQIRSFLTVVEEGSLHQVAVRLRISPSALTRQMQALEHELGGRLLERMITGVRSFLASGFPPLFHLTGRSWRAPSAVVRRRAPLPQRGAFP
jgi:hypothetical protein